jgi:hypothetical protein
MPNENPWIELLVDQREMLLSGSGAGVCCGVSNPYHDRCAISVTVRPVGSVYGCGDAPGWIDEELKDPGRDLGKLFI